MKCFGNYKTKVKCTNCDFEGKIFIDKGVKVENAECPACGTKSLVPAK